MSLWRTLRAASQAAEHATFPALAPAGSTRYELIWRLRNKRLQDGRRMRTALCILMLSSMLFGGCRTAKKVAVTSFRVVDAPARYIRERIDEGDPTTTTTTTTTTSDVTNPGYVPQTVPPPPTGPNVATTNRTTTSPAGTANRPVAPQPSPAAPRRPAAPTATPAATQFPVARPVPGRPGYVYSLDPNGGMIDVTGYKPGDKAKDPYTKQIFIVP